MEPFTTLDAVVVPLDRANVDTDAIIPGDAGGVRCLAHRIGDHLFDG